MKEQLAAPPVQAATDSGSTALPWKARLGACTDVGRVRGNNEDRLVVLDLGSGKPVAADSGAVAPLESAGLLLAVADGMGGMKAGEQASQMCVDLFPASVQKSLRGAPAAAEQIQDALSQALQETHEAIRNHAAAESLQGMGTTVTGVLLQGRTAWIAQVGDSRAYLGRGGAVEQLTRDQTVWEHMRGSNGGQQPEADEASELASAPWKNMLMQALGAQPDLQVVVTGHTLEAGDWLLLCSDGLYRVVQPADMAAAFARPNAPAEKARELVDLANQRGGPDNVSTIVCQVVEAQ